MLKDTFNWIRQNPGTILKWALLLCIIYFPIFLDLGDLPLRIWDEARLAESAFEMHKSGNYLITTIGGHSDGCSPKPPLMIWLQVICMKIIGVNDLATRLPSAISAFLTCVLITVFTTRHLKSFWWGFGAVVVLVTSRGYINMHAARSGDYDVPLTLFITSYCLSFYAYTHTKQKKYITMTFIGLTLAVLTKDVAGLMFVPALGIFALIKGHIPALLRNKAVYINAAVFLFIVIGYYVLREHYDPGYLKDVSGNELGGRYLKVIEGHSGGFWYYFNNMVNSRFNYWYLLVLAGVVVGLANKNAQTRGIVFYSTLLITVYFIIISGSATKLDWYDVPMYPFMAIIIGGLLQFFSGLIEKLENLGQVKSPALQYLFMFFIFFYPYTTIIGETYKPQEPWSWDVDFYRIENYLKDAIKTKKYLNNYHLCYQGYSIQVGFYTNILTDAGSKIDITDQMNFKPGDKILVCQQDVEDSVLKKYSCTKIDEDHNVRAYQVSAIK